MTVCVCVFLIDNKIYKGLIKYSLHDLEKDRVCVCVGGGLLLYY